MSLPDDQELNQDGRTTYARAESILREARRMGVRLRTDGRELLALMPVRVPPETRRRLEIALYQHKAQIIDLIIQREGGTR